MNMINKGSSTESILKAFKESEMKDKGQIENNNKKISIY